MKAFRSNNHSRPDSQDHRNGAGDASLPGSTTRSAILVIGSSNTDMIIRVARVPKSGETILGGNFASTAGGKGANQAVAAARAGGEVTFIARVGDDVFGESAVAGFASEGIRTEFIAIDPAKPSGVALIFVGDNGENSIAVASGANAALSPPDLRRARQAFSTARVVLLQLEIPMKTVEAAVALASAAGARVILNPAPAQTLALPLLKQLYLLTPNESETELLTGVAVSDEKSASYAAEKLLRRGLRNVIITMGARGALLASREERHFIPAYRTSAVDTTGAGDVFNGTLSMAIAEGQPLLDAAKFASAAAAISVTRPGAQGSAPTRSEIEQVIATGRILRGASIRNGRMSGEIAWTAAAKGSSRKLRNVSALP